MKAWRGDDDAKMLIDKFFEDLVGLKDEIEICKMHHLRMSE